MYLEQHESEQEMTQLTFLSEITLKDVVLTEDHFCKETIDVTTDEQHITKMIIS